MGLGHDRERAAKRLLEDEGWFVIRAPGSLGVADLVALRAYDDPGSSRGRLPEARMIEVKATARGPFAGFPPADRAELHAAAEKAGAEPWLLWWPSRKQPQWIPWWEWPEVRR